MKYENLKAKNITDNITVYNCDCMELLKQTPDNYYSLGVVDPPYGLGDKLTKGGTWSVKWQTKGADWDVTPQKEYFQEVFRVCKNIIIFGANYFIDKIPADKLISRGWIAWHKPYMDGMHSMSNVELAYTSFDLNAKKVSFNKDKGNEERIHVCQKPVKLYEWILRNYANKGDLILDTHLGSGSIAIAAHNLGFNLTATEIDPEYYNNAIKRIQLHTSQISANLSYE